MDLASCPDEELVANLKKIRRHDLEGWAVGCLLPILLAGIGLALGLVRYRSLLLGLAFALALPIGVFGLWEASISFLFGSQHLSRATQLPRNRIHRHSREAIPSYV